MPNLRKRTIDSQIGDEDRGNHKNLSSNKKAKKTPSPKPDKPKETSTLSAAKQYKDTLTTIDKSYIALEKRISHDDRGPTVPMFADAMVKILPEVNKLISASPRCALSAMVYLSLHAYAGSDLGCWAKIGGSSFETDDQWEKMDETMLGIVDKMNEAQAGSEAVVAMSVKQDELMQEYLALLQSIAHEDEPTNAERNQIVKCRRKAYKEYCENILLETESAEDWKKCLLCVLTAMKERLHSFGLDDSFYNRSIEKLQELHAAMQLTNEIVSCQWLHDEELENTGI